MQTIYRPPPTVPWVIHTASNAAWTGPVIPRRARAEPHIGRRLPLQLHATTRNPQAKSAVTASTEEHVDLRWCMLPFAPHPSAVPRPPYGHAQRQQVTSRRAGVHTPRAPQIHSARGRGGPVRVGREVCPRSCACGPVSRVMATNAREIAPNSLTTLTAPALAPPASAPRLATRDSHDQRPCS
jgi:hypothetical protein